MVRSRVLLICLTTVLARNESVAQQTYRRAEVDSSGQLRIITSNGREIRPAKDSDQVAFDQVALSSDRRTVGWVALYPNCCTSYPIPLKLVLLTQGIDRTVTGNGLPIWAWSFADDGKRVVFRQAPIHGAAPAHFELRDIRTGRLVSSYDAEADSVTRAPKCARVLKPPQ